ncbi:hypothetical protein [Streptomyces griseiscabiei]|uniref:Uncharacterized protein n=1 Tax=Streptomyces griseiscabiei TaxID=2993540 RepID=A0ABU4KXV8_9ACTN|nr:hypothetical protein [Streptomyces griseiscabiei]MBZ3904477.1 hypothetical protein [Streptomyces griseiscabiei]MDX2908226.1 hypothetical protein [Streptomyces griseiscabiei]
MARILDGNGTRAVSGPATAMARIEAGGPVVRHDRDGGTHWIAEAGSADEGREHTPDLMGHRTPCAYSHYKVQFQRTKEDCT